MGIWLILIGIVVILCGTVLGLCRFLPSKRGRANKGLTSASLVLTLFGTLILAAGAVLEFAIL